MTLDKQDKEFLNIVNINMSQIGLDVVNTRKEFSNEIENLKKRLSWMERVSEDLIKMQKQIDWNTKNTEMRFGKIERRLNVMSTEQC